MKKNKKALKKKKIFPGRVIFCAGMFFLEVALLIALVYFVVTIQLFSDYWYIPFLLLFVIDFVLAVFIMNSRVQVDFKLSWIVVLILLPFGGALIYLLFANKVTTKKKKELRHNKINKYLCSAKVDSTETLNELEKDNIDAYAISNYIENNALNSLYKNTEVTYYRYGQYGFPHMLEELKKAKRFIFIEYFIIESGEMFDSIYEILLQKVKEGVDVRLIYDDFGSVKGVEKHFYKECAKQGIKCFAFNNIRPFLDIRQNSRDHRKIMVIDGVRAFTGGCNLADEYINKEERFGDWRDNIVMIKGEGVNGLTALFLSSWSLMYKKEKDHTRDDFKIYCYETNKDLLTETINTSGYIQAVGEVPFDSEESARNVILSMISRAKKSIYISTPYLILDSELITALQNAAKSNVNVCIVTPGIPDKKIVNSMGKSYYSELLTSGVKIYEYKPGFNHAKVVIVDEIMAFTGTVNLDFRSLYLHFENGVFLYKNDCLKEIQSDLEDMIKVGRKVKESTYLKVNIFRKIRWGILHIIAPLI